MEPGKYGPLADFLGNCRRADKGALAVTLSFGQIERIIGCKLPASARNGPSFWGNDLTHAQARTWIGEGWRSRDVSVDNQVVTFASDTKATQKTEQATALQLATLMLGSRSAAQDQIRTLKARAKASPPQPALDLGQLALMAEALTPLGWTLETHIHPPPARGHRTKPGAGSLTATRTGHTQAKIRMTFVGGRIEVDTILGDDIREVARWPHDRAREAWLFIALWESDKPWLVASTNSAVEQDSPVGLRGSLSLTGTPSDAERRRVFSWLAHETDAFEDGLRKILWRKRPVSARRAMELARRRLGRHVRPPEELVRARPISTAGAQRG
jgi:hypothetical protein